MDAHELDRLENAVIAGLKSRQAPSLPLGFSARVMREIAAKAEVFDPFSRLRRIFAPIFAVGAAAAACLVAYAVFGEDPGSQYLFITKLQDPASSLLALRFFL